MFRPEAASRPAVATPPHVDGLAASFVASSAASFAIILPRRTMFLRHTARPSARCARALRAAPHARFASNLHIDGPIRSTTAILCGQLLIAFACHCGTRTTKPCPFLPQCERLVFVIIAKSCIIETAVLDDAHVGSDILSTMHHASRLGDLFSRPAR